MARKYLRRYPFVARRIQTADLASAAVMGMIAAGRFYDASRGVSFTSFAWPWVTGQIKKSAARARLFRQPFHLSPLADQADPRQVEPIDALHHADRMEQLERALLRLDPQDAEAVRRRIGGQTLVQIGTAMASASSARASVWSAG
jgi:RNA polymerase sigma factor (sigma-70 family)